MQLAKKKKKDKSPAKMDQHGIGGGVVMTATNQQLTGGGVTQGHYNPSSLWNSFPNMYETAAYQHQQPVYPGMVNQYAAHAQASAQAHVQNVPPLQNVMRIGECSIKPIGQ